LFTPVPPPFASADATEAVREIMSKSATRIWCLWPFKFSVIAYPTGSRSYVVEFRPFWKFALTVSFFWKAPGA
jgi:hypothetical protein